MQRRIRFFAFLFALFLSVGLYGCGTSSIDAGKEKSVRGTDAATPSENVSENKTETTEEQKPVEGENKETTSSSEQNNVAQKDTGKAQPSKTSGKALPSTKNSTTANKSTESKKDAAPTKSTPTPKKTVPLATKPANTNTGNSDTPEKKEPVTLVSLTIQGPKDHGAILSNVKVSVENGESILTVLLREAKTQKMHIDYRGSGSTAYVQGIEDDAGKWSFYEFDLSATSGWVFKLNGVSLTKSIGITTVKDGDRIECIYTE